MAIYPTPEQIKDLLAGPADQPVVMINLLRFKPRADATEGDATGREAYQRYAEQMREMVESQGGRFIWAGSVDSMVIGEEDPGFHVVGLVEYPSRQKFLEIAGSERVREIGAHRSAGRESQWLWAAAETRIFVGPAGRRSEVATDQGADERALTGSITRNGATTSPSVLPPTLSTGSTRRAGSCFSGRLRDEAGGSRRIGDSLGRPSEEARARPLRERPQAASRGSGATPRGSGCPATTDRSGPGLVNPGPLKEIVVPDGRVLNG